MERRSEPRFMCADLVRVVAAAAPPEELVATLEDISPSGACLQVERPVPAGTAVEIVCGSCRFKGTVRYCRFVGIGYDIGVQFERRGTWTRHEYLPKHLLDVPELAWGRAGRGPH